MSKRNNIIPDRQTPRQNELFGLGSGGYWIATIWLALGMVSTGAVQLFKGKTGQGGSNRYRNRLVED